MWNLWKTSETEATTAKLSEQVRDLEGRMKTLEMEWANTYTKLKRLTGHITKTAALDQQQTNSSADADSKVIGTHDRLLTMRGKHGVLPR